MINITIFVYSINYKKKIVCHSDGFVQYYIQSAIKGQPVVQLPKSFYL